jgi:hypothetical protein
MQVLSPVVALGLVLSSGSFYFNMELAPAMRFANRNAESLILSRLGYLGEGWNFEFPDSETPLWIHHYDGPVLEGIFVAAGDRGRGFLVSSDVLKSVNTPSYPEYIFARRGVVAAGTGEQAGRVVLDLEDVNLFFHQGLLERARAKYEGDRRPADAKDRPAEKDAKPPPAAAPPPEDDSGKPDPPRRIAEAPSAAVDPARWITERDFMHRGFSRHVQVPIFRPSPNARGEGHGPLRAARRDGDSGRSAAGRPIHRRTRPRSTRPKGSISSSSPSSTVGSAYLSARFSFRFALSSSASRSTRRTGSCRSFSRRLSCRPSFSLSRCSETTTRSAGGHPQSRRSSATSRWAFSQRSWHGNSIARRADELRRFAAALRGRADSAVRAHTLCPSRGRRPVTGILEERVAITSREMWRAGEWILPTMNGEPRLQKPPFAYWIVEGFANIRGAFDDWTLRLPFATLAAGTALLVWAIGRSEGGPALGLVAAIVLLTSSLFIAESHRATADPAQLFCAAGAWLFYLRERAAAYTASNEQEGGIRRRLRRWRRVGFYFFLGLGALAKGPVILLLCVAPPFVEALVRRSRTPLRPLASPVGIAIFLVLALAWPIAVARRLDAIRAGAPVAAIPKRRPPQRSMASPWGPCASGFSSRSEKSSPRRAKRRGTASSGTESPGTSICRGSCRRSVCGAPPWPGRFLCARPEAASARRSGRHS